MNSQVSERTGCSWCLSYIGFYLKGREGVWEGRSKTRDKNTYPRRKLISGVRQH